MDEYSNNITEKTVYDKLVKHLNQCITNYFTKHVSLISDEKYDKLYRILVETEKQHPDWITSDSPTQKVGELESNFPKKKHISRMYSLDNIFDHKGLTSFLKRFSPFKKEFSDVDQYYVDCKLDGAAIELIYTDKKLTSAITRGDGQVGCDILVNAMTIPNIPHRIQTSETVIVRGEVVVHKEDFLNAQHEREENHLPPFSNCRNYASGSLMQKDPEVTKKRNLRFYGWELIVPSNLNLSHDQQIKYLTKLGFNVPVGRLCYSSDEILSLINEIARMKIELPYEIDGAVIKQNQWEYRKPLGWNNHAPKWAVAWKFHTDGAETTIKKIRWSMGRTGRLTPVAVIEPVSINGVTISEVNIYNANYIESNHVGPGAKIRVIRSGEVIPRITEIITKGTYIGIPTTCPYCGETVIYDGTILRCNNPNCKEILISLITNAVSDDMLNIPGIGETTIRYLVENNEITNFIDIFFPIISQNKRIQSLADKLVSRMQQINNMELLLIIGIPGMGRAIAGRLATETRSLEGFRKLLENPKELKLLMISDIVKKNLINWYNIPGNKKLINKLVELKLSNLK